MKTRLFFVLGAGVGYVLGTRAGREQYEKLTEKLTQAWEHPTVQQGVTQAEQALHSVVSEHGPELAKRALHATRDTLGLELPAE